MPLPSGRPQLSDETPGPALAILAICSAGASALVAGSAIAYQLQNRDLVRGSRLNLEWNILLTFALVICIAQSAVTAVQVDNGLGYPIRMLTSDDVTIFLKLEYANNLLYIGSLLLLKGVQFLLQIATTFPKPDYWAPSIVLVGMAGFFFAAAFECSSPFWKLRENKCIDQTAFWIAFGIFDIVSDVYSVSIVIWSTSTLKLHTPNKIKLLVILGSKLLPSVCAIARLPFIHPAYTSSNYTIALYRLGMPTQLQLHLSVVALSLGKIFRFLNFLDVGYLSSAIEPTSGKGTVNRSRGGKYGYNSKMSNHSSSHNHHHHHLKNKKSISDHDSSKNLVPCDYQQQTLVESDAAVQLGKVNRDQKKPQHSHDRPVAERLPTGNEILVTTQYEIRSESAARDGSRGEDELDNHAF